MIVGLKCLKVVIVVLVRWCDLQVGCLPLTILLKKLFAVRLALWVYLHVLLVHLDVYRDGKVVTKILQ